MSELVVTPFGMYGNSGDACYVKVSGQGRLNSEQKLEIERRVNNYDAQAEHLRLKEEECKQLQQDKAELVEVLIALSNHNCPIEYCTHDESESFSKIDELVEKHKCD